MSPRRLMVCWCAVALVAAAAGGLPPVETVFGPSQGVYLTGNGGLTVVLDASGRLVACRWPRPGSLNQVTPPGPGHEGGALWGITRDGATDWVTGLRWVRVAGDEPGDMGVVRLESRAGDGSATGLRQTLFVHPERDLLVSRIEVQEADTPEGFVWFANLSPMPTRTDAPVVPEAVLRHTADFAVFAGMDGRTAFHFRPGTVTEREWHHAEALMHRSADPTAWSVFDRGVWIGATGLNAVRMVSCVGDGEGAALFERATSANLEPRASAVGRCSSALTLEPAREGDTWSGTVVVALSDDWAGARDALDRAEDIGFDMLLHETRRHWEKQLGKAVLPPGTPQELRPPLLRCVATLLACTDRRSGGTVRRPGAGPPLHVDHPRHAAPLTRAFNAYGYPERAGTRIRFLASAIREQDRPDAPAGSAPYACWTDGTPAALDGFFGVQDSAGFLWAAWRHAFTLDAAPREALLRDIWPAVERAGGILVRWADSHRGLPLHSYNPSLWRQERSRELLPPAKAGLEGAIRIAEAVAATDPAWNRRHSELLALCLSLCLDLSGDWTLEDPLPHWPARIMPVGDRRWQPHADAALARLPEMPRDQAAATLADVAAVAGSNRDMLEAVRPHLARLLGETGTPPDSLTCARLLLTAAAVFGA